MLPCCGPQCCKARPNTHIHFCTATGLCTSLGNIRFPVSESHVGSTETTKDRAHFLLWFQCPLGFLVREVTHHGDESQKDGFTHSCAHSEQGCIWEFTLWCTGVLALSSLHGPARAPAAQEILRQSDPTGEAVQNGMRQPTPHSVLTASNINPFLFPLAPFFGLVGLLLFSICKILASLTCLLLQLMLHLLGTAKPRAHIYYFILATQQFQSHF